MSQKFLKIGSKKLKKINYFNKIIWAAAAVLIVFGASGAFGIKLPNSAKSEIKSLNSKIAKLEKNMRESMGVAH